MNLFLGDIIQTQDGLYLIKYKLGWVISGRLSHSNSETVMENAMFSITSTSTLLPPDIHHLANNSTAGIFEPNTEDLWNLDTIGIKERNKLQDDDSIRQAFKDLIKKKNGTYE